MTPPTAAPPPAASVGTPQTGRLDRLSDRAGQAWLRPPAFVAVGVFLIAAWVAIFWSIYAETGLFLWLGVDFFRNLALAEALRAEGPSAIYSLDAMERHMRVLDPNLAVMPVVVAYAPIFAYLFLPFTFFPPHVGFILWTGLNLLATVWLARRVIELFQRAHRSWAVVLLVTSIPVASALMFGQPAILLACAVAEFYLSLRGGHELRAGLWLSLLIFKPQYGIILGPLLLWKGRWAAVGGAALGVGVIMASSALVAGIPTLLGYPDALSDKAGLRSDYPHLMINWRSLILLVAPEIPNRVGTVLVALLGGATLLGVALAWRGPWDREGPRFAAKITLALVATLIANFHSHLHGAALLAVPLAAMLAAEHLGRATRLIVGAGLVLPVAVFAILTTANPVLDGLSQVVVAYDRSARLFALLLVALYGSLVLSALRTRTQARTT
jgi:hypothetical protein